MSNVRVITVAFDTSYEGDLEADLIHMITPRARNGLIKIGNMLEKKIKDILSQPGTGSFYRSRTGRGMHQASAPEEAPAPDRKVYRDSWEAEITSTKEEVTLNVSTPLWTVFGRRLELGGFGGGAYIAPRPHARKAWDESIPEIDRILDTEVGQK